MKLKDVDYLTWVQHNCKPYHVCERYGDQIRLRDSDKNDIYLSMYEDVELIAVPVFNVGDIVLYKGWALSQYGKLLPILQYNGSSYSPYSLGGSVWATPFEITPINY